MLRLLVGASLQLAVLSHGGMQFEVSQDKGPQDWFHEFHEDNYDTDADPSFLKKCVPQWQEECRKTYAHNKELQTQLCETHLDRNYVKIRTLIPPEDILKQWKWDRQRRDYDIGWVRSTFPTFSPTGAKYLQLPAELHESMARWYKRNRHRTGPEASQPAFGFNCNTGHDNDDWVVPYQPDDDESRKTFAAVKEWIRKELSAWIKRDVNEQTAIYGAREYHRGSVCGMHTDAMQTHAFSAIYQLDQFGMDEPWGLDYVTHQGKAERVYMKPGDIVLYEGASTMHGRKDALKGDQFTNVFYHFRTSEWEPAVTAKLDHYWDTRRKYEVASRTTLTSLGNAGPVKRHWTSDDQCIPQRSRLDPLMPEGHFMDLPPPEAFDPHLKSYKKSNQLRNPDLHTDM
jgi:hypothetical protein